MTKDEFLSDAQGIKDDFDSVPRESGVGIVSIQMICVAIFKLLWLYIAYRVARDRD